MAIVKQPAIAQYLKSPPAAVRAYLAYGSDTGSVHETARLAVAQHTGTHDDPMSVVHLSEDKLKEDPGRLNDEAAAISMFGGHRAIWLRDPGPAGQKALVAFLEHLPGEARLVVEAGNLAKSSALRKMFESHNAAVAIPCYADETRGLHDLIHSVLGEAGLTIDRQAAARLASRLGNDRGVSRGEIEKLALYCYGNESVSEADIDAVCGDNPAESIDSLLDAAFEGNADEACRQFLSLIEGSGSGPAVLTFAGRHIAFLEQLRVQMDAGKSADAVIRSSRPPVFFKRQESVARQLRLWSLAALARARKTIFETTLRSRELPALDLELTERCLMSLARNAQAARLGKA